jgi:beta-galactosidase
VTHWAGTDAFAAYQDWGEWTWRYLDEAYQAWSGALGNVSKVINISPPARAKAGPKMDAWLCRVRPERLAGLQYGFTSWAGNAMCDEQAFTSYVLAAKRRRGPNLEENWGFPWSDPRCVHPVSPAYHAVLALAAGATGFSVYPACGTDSWGSTITADRNFLARNAYNLETYDPPYGHAAPITTQGQPGAKFETLRLLGHFLKAEGESLMGCAERLDLAWAVYTPYSQLTAWRPPASERYRGLRLPLPASQALVSFSNGCIDRGVGFGMVDIETASLAGLNAYPRLVLAGSYFMSAPVQEKLARYVERGGTLMVLWESPEYNEKLESCRILKERLLDHEFSGKEDTHRVDGLPAAEACRPLKISKDATTLLSSPSGTYGYQARRGDGQVIYLDTSLSSGSVAFLLDALDLGAESDGAKPPFVAEYACEGAQTTFIFALSRSDKNEIVRREIGRIPLEVRLAGRSCAIVKFSAGKLAGCFVKGVNEVSGRGAPVFVRYDDQEIATDIHCDLVAVLKDGRFLVEATAPKGARPIIRLPSRSISYAN